MPVETIKCQECGSADVTEFKAGTYVCAHCEAVFKHVSPAAAGGGCEIDDCGVPAVGRCSSCNRRFCGTHQARDEKGSYVDWCRACQEERRATERHHDFDKCDAWVAGARAILDSVSEPMARLAVVAACLGTLKDPITHGIARVLIPDVLPAEIRPGEQWDHDAIQEWFMKTVDGPPPESWEASKSVPGRLHWLRGDVPEGMRTIRWTESGWRFREGSDSSYRDETVICHHDVMIYADGRRSSGFNVRALRQMASLVGLPELHPLVTFPSSSAGNWRLWLDRPQ